MDVDKAGTGDATDYRTEQTRSVSTSEDEDADSVVDGWNEVTQKKRTHEPKQGGETRIRSFNKPDALRPPKHRQQGSTSKQDALPRDDIKGACHDTSPDLSIWSDVGTITWSNNFEDLGSDHRVVCVTMGEDRGKIDGCQKARVVDWDKFRAHREREKQEGPIKDMGEWCRELLADVEKATKNRMARQAKRT
ncbi:hypothetical protein HPB51_027580 [Rhipicephalus microplus]|uniref:Uncharacterized protein n=1 Tax=Rhipicephalus microplus TaxID=6941 RepID=A0A9J6CZV0_RHIMP|nr:hypothetical protein HPB51_027580 [Rhipicephalus microplus]